MEICPGDCEAKKIDEIETSRFYNIRELNPKCTKTWVFFSLNASYNVYGKVSLTR